MGLGKASWYLSQFFSIPLDGKNRCYQGEACVDNSIFMKHMEE